MKLLHLANHHSTNVGNGALIHGTERVLTEDLGDQVTFVPEAWDDYTLRGLRRFDGEFVDLVNRSDALLVGGAVTFNGRAQFANAGMRIDLPVELWAKIDRPVVFYGVSYRVWPGQPYHHRERLRQTIAYLAEHPRVFFGVRNDGTKAWLEALIGYSSDGIVAVPDPGLYVSADDHPRAEIDRSRINLVLSLNDEDDVYRFGGRLREAVWTGVGEFVDDRTLGRAWRRLPGWQNRRRAFLRKLAVALERLVRRWDMNVILTPHYVDDYRMMADFVAVCPPWLAHQAMISSGLAKVPQTAYFYALYAQADVAISMRVHSMSPAIGLGTPCVALVSQARMRGFLADAGLLDFGVDVFDADLVEKLEALVARCLGDREGVRDRQRRTRQRMRERTAAYNHRIASLLRN
ncbi:MAG: polysaccharide pyruvyl transferase family protein [Candidatus Rokubacteria bacterium]|nr:polysaccharide pyruvyl transferase family protein [Candidatus Rokubacteria bacterium]